MEIRIYYESIEQAAHYILPLIKKNFSDISDSCTIKLIRLRGDYKKYSKSIAPIIYWKDPDILITLVNKSEEIPLLMIEFSNAVFTEDHELQRFDGLVAAAENNCIYAKISPISKKSRSNHGGNTDFNYVGPYALIYKKFKKVFYHFDWPCSNKIVTVDNNFLSCPTEIAHFNSLIQNLANFVINKRKFDEHWIIDFQNALCKVAYFDSWKDSLTNFRLPEITKLSSSRTEWNNETKELVLKINRFGHAMDPERGMLSYYGTLYNNTNSKMMFSEDNFAWYKDIPKENEIRRYIESNGLKKNFDFLFCFLLGSGLYQNNDFKNIVGSESENDKEIIEIELSSFLKKNYFGLSKSLRTIFKKSKKLLISDKQNKIRVILCWKPFIADEFNNFQKVTQIKNREIFDEDDITYISVHNILRKNNFQIIAVSYPGAQGDRVVLISPGTGRGQERRYIDIVSYLPNVLTSIQENKGKFNASQIEKDINEVSLYKTDKEHVDAINGFLNEFASNAPRKIKIGVGFWANKNFNISTIKDLCMDELDYFIYISSDKQKWNIWSTGSENIFKISSGKVEIPQTFEVE